MWCDQNGSRGTGASEGGGDYFNRNGTAKLNMLDYKPDETRYFYTQNDSSGASLPVMVPGNEANAILR